MDKNILDLINTVNGIAVAHAELELSMVTEFQIIEELLIRKGICSYDELVSIKDYVEANDDTVKQVTEKLNNIKSNAEQISKRLDEGIQLIDHVASRDDLSEIFMKEDSES